VVTSSILLQTAGNVGTCTCHVHGQNARATYRNGNVIGCRQQIVADLFLEDAAVLAVAPSIAKES
jgi:hypothetical protein